MKRNIVLPRQASLATPEILNPFSHKIVFNTFDYFKIGFMTVFVLPLRLILLVTFLLLGWLLAAISLAFRSDKDKLKPLTGWRNMLRPAVILMCRAVFFAGGFHWISVKGQRVSCKEAPVLALVPHSSYFDALPVVYLGLSTTVAKHETFAVPIFGTLMEYTQPIYVKREDPNSRSNTIKEIQKRARSGGEWPQIVIFPEGTCTNRSCIISFKSGAFYPGVPIQPVCLRYPNKMDTVSWTWEGPGVWKLLWLTLCQFHNYLEIEFLPVYVPNEEEKKDAKLFARNVRDKIAECLDVPTTDHTFDDCRLMQKAAKLNLPKAAGIVEFQKLNAKLGVKFEDLQSLLDKYKSIAKSNKEGITLEEFACHLHLPLSDAMRDLFALYDRNESGVIDFREYVIGLSLVSSPANTEDTIKLAFQLFDKDNKGHITQDELVTILQNAFGMEDIEEVQELFNEIDEKEDNKITYDEFRAFAEKKPEYARLFTRYRELRDDNDNNGDVSHEKAE